jgi:hypothetical protein
MEQLDAYLALELPHLTTQRWLGDVEAVGGVLESSCFRDRHHVAHQPEIDGHARVTGTG